MRRKYTDSLIQWKKNPHRHPLLLQGLRQTGKTWLALDFAEKNYMAWRGLTTENNSSGIRS